MVTQPRIPSLRNIVLFNTGQDVRRCRCCSACSVRMDAKQDISLEGLVQLVILNDEEVLTTRTLWSEKVLEASKRACNGEIDLEAVLLALRQEALRRGVNIDNILTSNLAQE